MRVLILGGDGMLGHMLLKSLGRSHDVRVTLRQDLAAYAGHRLFDARNSYAGVDVRELDRLSKVMADFRPEAVINAVGIVKQRATAKESIPSLEINALLPHRLAVLCGTTGARLIHMSTDCVFSGKKGGYVETDPPDADDLYGRSKLLGEVGDPGCITLRTSIIGPELSRKKSLLEWFLAQSGPVKGFRNAIFSGVTTIEMARIIDRLLVAHPEAYGLYHVSASAISKLDLLTLIKTKLGLRVTIVPDDELQIDRSLDSTRFRREFGYVPPSWESMIDELAHEIRQEDKR